MRVAMFRKRWYGSSLVGTEIGANAPSSFYFSILQGCGFVNCWNIDVECRERFGGRYLLSDRYCKICEVPVVG